MGEERQLPHNVIKIVPIQNTISYFVFLHSLNWFSTLIWFASTIYGINVGRRRPPSEMWNSKGPLTPAHQAPCVELSSDVTLKSRPHPKYIRQHLQTNVPKGPLMVDYPYETILNMFHMNSAHSNQIYQNHLACILTSLFMASRWIVYCQMNTAPGISLKTSF